ncbi:MAG: hypothetical protein OEY14_18380 [Myxococcales bacterium]|nr:hypothetical protein [Myxococcales bacterium]
MSTLGKSVRFYWRGEDGLGLNQIVETSFYPTSIRWIARNGGIRFVVSGKRPLAWATVVEEWILEEPRVLVEASLGVKHFGRARVRQVTSIYDAAVPGRDMVLASWRDGVDEDRMLLQFWDSRDVYALDLDTGGLEILASPVEGHAPVWQPDLSAHTHRGYPGIWSRNHAAFGVIHVMPCDVDPERWLILIDANRDGTPESSLLADDDTWSVLGFDLAANYLD